MAKLIICIDGFGKDLVNEEDTPFLHNFGKENFSAELETLFAFTGLEYGFFSGKTPEETRVWLEFVKSKNSIFDTPLVKLFSFNKKIQNNIMGLYQYLKGLTWISGTHNIPTNKIKYFSPAVNKGLWKLKFFQEKDFAFYKWPFFVTKEKEKEKIKLVFKYENDQERLNRLVSEKKDLYYTQLMEVDKILHKFGKKSLETKKVVRKMDKLLEKTVKDFLNENREGEVFLWSDHGFCDVDNYIDIEKQLPKRDDYLYFIAGTTIHFWFENEDLKKEILEILEKNKIKILTNDLAKKYKIGIEEKYGDLVGFVEKENYFFPNFYQKSEKERFVAMHGYPDDNELSGFLISNKKIPKKLKIHEAANYIK